MQGMLLTQAGGPLGPIAWVLGKIMEAIFYVLDFIGIHDIGLSIILFTVIVYLLMMPMTIKQQKFSKLSAKMQPEIQAIQKKYQGKTDQASMMKQQEETKAVYDKYGTSPSGSCLQLLIQMPILFALYKVIQAIPAYVGKIKDIYNPLVEKLVTVDGAREFIADFNNSALYKDDLLKTDLNIEGGVEIVKNKLIDCLNMASTAEWNSLAEKYANSSLGDKISEVSTQISEYNQFLGLNIGNTPMDIIKEGWDTGAYVIVFTAIMIPVLAAATQWLNAKLMPTSNDNKNNSDNPMANSMKTMNMVMPLMSAWFCLTLPCGMGIYWIAGAVVRSIQQVSINKYIDKHINFDELIDKNKEAAAAKAKKRKEKNEKLMAQAESLSQTATKSTKNISRKANLGSEMSAEEREARMKEIEKYSKSSQKSASGSIASKANLVKEFNENNKQ